MNPIWCNLAAVAVGLLYCFWRTHRRQLGRKHQQIRERVAYMLWVMADHSDESKPFSRGSMKAI
jgi:hypothetical protein